MREVIEFRIWNEYAHLLLGTDKNRNPHGITIITKDANDPIVEKIRVLQGQIKEKFDDLFCLVEVKRNYTRKELDEAALLRINIKPTFEPAGEECGTEFDESSECDICGVNRKQLGPLKLDRRSIPRKDIARTIAGEVIVSQRLAEKVVDAELKGFELRPVLHKAHYEGDSIDFRRLPLGREVIAKAESAGFPYNTAGFYIWLNRIENQALADRVWAEYIALRENKERRRGASLKPVGYYQLTASSSALELTKNTIGGINYFDLSESSLDEVYKCPRGHTIGLNCLSEAYVSNSPVIKSYDFFTSRQYFGVKRGLLRPEPLYFCSQAFRKLIMEEKFKGFGFEVAHIE